ncbi:MAG: acyl carrier protein [Bacteroidales bacterium]|nr:acyl carrier protein [Bacteroidales bacterium]
MDLNEFVTLFAEQFDETPLDEFKPTTVYKDLEEWGSLTALSIIAMVDEELEKRITGADIRTSNTIEDLFTLIRSK